MHRRRFALLLSLLVVTMTANAATNETDSFGITKLHLTVNGGREWFAQWQAKRAIPSYEMDPKDAVCRNEEGILKIQDGTATAPAGMTRVVVLTPTNQAGQATLTPWRNVEMTVYARRGASKQTLDYQAFYLSARSGERHDESVACDGTSYHATWRFDGQCGFKKEIWHTGGYTQLAPTPTPHPWKTVPRDQWIGLKFVCRNVNHEKNVRLEMYLDLNEHNEWKLISEYTDTGGWLGERDGCDRPRDYIITEARPAVYFRTDQVDVELKKFSVREIAPLP